MVKIGLTGGVGAGKSQVLQWMEQYAGAKIIRTDDLARRIMEPGEDGFIRVVEALGNSFLDKEGRIDRPALARLIFNDETARTTVNSITHPLVWKMVEEELENAKKEGRKWSVVESAIFDEHALACFDEIWYVYAPDEVRIERLMQGRNYSRKRCEEMIASQLSDLEFRQISSRILDNGGSWDRTEKQLEQLCFC